MDDKLLTVEEICEFLGISRRTLYNLKKEGLPYYKLGNLLRFNKNNVLEWLEKFQTTDKK